MSSSNLAPIKAEDGDDQEKRKPKKLKVGRYSKFKFKMSKIM